MYNDYDDYDSDYTGTYAHRHPNHPQRTGA